MMLDANQIEDRVTCMKKHIIVLVFLLTISIVACNKNKNDSVDEGTSAPASAPVADDSPTAEKAVPTAVPEANDSAGDNDAVKSKECEKLTNASSMVSLDKDTYSLGKITVSVKGITEKMQSESAFVAIYRANAAHEAWGKYDYPPVGDSQLTFDVPDDGGQYEMRLYCRDGQYDSGTLVTSVPFTVNELLLESAVALDAAVYPASGQIIANVTGITQRMHNAKAFVSVYKAGSAHNAWGEYHYPSAGDSVLTFNVPEEGGAYEMRLYNRDGQYDDTTLVLSVPFMVLPVGGLL